MRVLFLLERFPALSETFIVTELLGLARAGHDVSVVSQHRPRSGEPLHPELARSDLLARTVYVDSPLAADSREPMPSLPLAPGRHDIVHAHFGPNARRFLFAREQARAPFVVTFHGYDLTAEPASYGASMYERVFEAADAVTYNCEHARRVLLSLRCPPDRLRRLRMPVEVAAMPFRERRRVDGRPLRLVTVGRLVEKKGHEIALRGLAAARPSLGDVRYDIVGSGDLDARLATLVRVLGLDDVVTLRGALDSSGVRRILATSDIFVLASKTASNGDQEGTPVALMEAQACGLPVLSTLHSGIPEVVLDGRTGHLVREGDVDAFADALQRAASESHSWATLGRTGRAHVAESFDVAPCTDELLDVYRFAISEHRRRTGS